MLAALAYCRATNKPSGCKVPHLPDQWRRLCSMSNPSVSNAYSPPTTSGAANPGNANAMDEQANAAGQAVERNPDGSQATRRKQRPQLKPPLEG